MKGLFKLVELVKLGAKQGGSAVLAAELGGPAKVGGPVNLGAKVRAGGPVRLYSPVDPGAWWGDAG